MNVNLSVILRKSVSMAKAKIKEYEEMTGTGGSYIRNLPTDPLLWIQRCRPIVEGVRRSFLATPFWEDIYQDMSHDLMVVAGRQIFKSTYCTDMLAFGATAFKSKQVCYVTHDTESLSAFSNQRLRVGTFEDNPILAQFPTHGTGSVGA